MIRRIRRRRSRGKAKRQIAGEGRRGVGKDERIERG